MTQRGQAENQSEKSALLPTTHTSSALRTMEVVLSYQEMESLGMMRACASGLELCAFWFCVHGSVNTLRIFERSGLA